MNPSFALSILLSLILIPFSLGSASAAGLKTLSGVPSFTPGVTVTKTAGATGTAAKAAPLGEAAKKAAATSKPGSPVLKGLPAPGTRPTPKATPRPTIPAASPKTSQGPIKTVGAPPTPRATGTPSSYAAFNKVATPKAPPTMADLQKALSQSRTAQGLDLAKARAAQGFNSARTGIGQLPNRTIQGLDLAKARAAQGFNSARTGIGQLPGRTIQGLDLAKARAAQGFNSARTGIGQLPGRTIQGLDLAKARTDRLISPSVRPQAVAGTPASMFPTPRAVTPVPPVLGSPLSFVDPNKYTSAIKLPPGTTPPMAIGRSAPALPSPIPGVTPKSLPPVQGLEARKAAGGVQPYLPNPGSTVPAPAFRPAAAAA